MMVASMVVTKAEMLVAYSGLMLVEMKVSWKAVMMVASMVVTKAGVWGYPLAVLLAVLKEPS